MTARLKSNLAQLAQMVADGLSICRIGLVSSYDPDHYAIKVTLQPNDEETGWMPIASMWTGAGKGMFSPPDIGAQAMVFFQEADRLTPLGGMMLFSDADNPLSVPSGEMWLQHATGSFHKLTNDGNLSITSAADTVHNATGNLTQTIGADSSHSISGNHTLTAQGDQTVSVTGSSSHTSADHTINAPTTVNGTVEASSTVSAGGTVTSGGSVEAQADVTSDAGANSLNAIAAELPGVISSLASTAATALAAATTATAASASVAAVTSSLSSTNSTVSNVSTSLAAMPQPGTNPNSVGYLGIPQTTQAASRNLTLADLGTEIFCTANLTITIPAHGTLGQIIGSFVKITADAGVTVTVAISSDTLVLETTGATGSRTITGRGHGVFTYEKTTEWWGIGSGLT